MHLSSRKQIAVAVQYLDEIEAAGLEAKGVVKLDKLRKARAERELAEEQAVQKEKRTLRDKVDAFYRDNPDFRGSRADLATQLGVSPDDINFRRFAATVGYRQRLLLTGPRAAE